MAVEKENVTPKGVLLVVSGPSGAGKGTICQMLREQLPDLGYSISVTTRQPRVGEVDGTSYFFKTVPQVQEMIAQGELLEYAEVYGNYYGTPLKKIQEKLSDGQDILLEIDTQGAMNVQKKFPEGLYIFLLPPSLKTLEERIRGRGSETDESLKRRLGNAVNEIEVGKNYNYVVVNDTVDAAVKRIAMVIDAEHRRVVRNMDLFEKLENEKKLNYGA